MTRTADNLDAIEPFLGELIQQLEPRSRRKAMDKLMRLVRRANAQRITRNVEPDGNAMTKRKPRKGKRGKMFRNIGKARNLRIRVTPDEGELHFGSKLIGHTAAVHHYGETGFVGKTRDGKIIRTKFDARRLLGFGPEQDELLDELLKQFSE
ncbi:MAG: phage virion morphogenesis protein [Novosphingobium sp.]|nr:phage virion morphogenesis protein [Novosphingobium sp.]